MIEIVFDKSYLDGASTTEVRDVCSRFSALMPQELFFEMITTRPESQRRCFSKLPDQDSPVALIPPVGVLVDFERQHQEACVPLARHRVDSNRYVFNRRLREGTFVPSADDSAHLAAWQSQVDSDTRAFVATSLAVSDVFPDLSKLRHSDLPAAVEKKRRMVATDSDFVRRIYAAGAPADAPPAARIDPRWAVFRVFQCRMLSALRMFGRHQGAMPHPVGTEFWTRAEHTMLDLYGLILGTLAGGFATLENELQQEFVLLCPDATPLARGLLGHAEG